MDENFLHTVYNYRYIIIIELHKLNSNSNDKKVICDKKALNDNDFKIFLIIYIVSPS